MSCEYHGLLSLNCIIFVLSFSIFVSSSPYVHEQCNSVSHACLQALYESNVILCINCLYPALSLFLLLVYLR